MITKISFQLYLIIYHALAQQNHFDIEIYTYIATHFFAKNYQISVQVVKFLQLRSNGQELQGPRGGLQTHMPLKIYSPQLEISWSASFLEKSTHSTCILQFTLHVKLF